MKKLFIIFLSLICLSYSKPAQAQVNPQDSLALLALYHSTDGPNWKRKKWDLTKPVSEWDGIVLVGNRAEKIHLSFNGLTGTIPVELGGLTNLTELGLNSNKLTGVIPSELGNLTNLTSLSLSSNKLTGVIPAELGRLTNLRYLYLSVNGLTGVIPAVLGNLINLTHLSLSSNKLTGTIPSFLGGLSDLRELYLFNNKLTGVIPVELGRLAHLKVLYISYNGLTGVIPTVLGNLTNLTHLRLSNNKLTGVIPAELGRLTNLLSLLLENNAFTDLPNLSNLSNLTRFQVQENALEFDDILPNISDLNNYSPQKDINEPMTIRPILGASTTLVTTTADDGTNTYQWFKDGTSISGAITSTYTFAYAASFNGIYYCEVKNTKAKKLTLTRKNITVRSNAPTAIILSADIIAENNAIESVIGMLSSVDMDTDDTHIYSLVSGAGSADNASFSISGVELKANKVFDYAKKSTYAIRLKTDDGNGGTLEQPFTVKITASPLSVDFNGISTIRLYPNPVSTYLVLEMDNRSGADLSYKIISISGKVLIQSEKNLTQQKYTIDTSSLSVGLYVLVVTQGGERVTQRFIKQ